MRRRPPSRPLPAVPRHARRRRGLVLWGVLLLHLVLGVVVSATHPAGFSAGGAAVAAQAADDDGGSGGSHGHGHGEQDCALCHGVHAPLALSAPQPAFFAAILREGGNPAPARAPAFLSASPARARAPPAA
jgi:hypothetical protein